MKKNDWILLASVFAYSFLFYKELAGLNFLLFNILLIVALVIKDKSLVKNKTWNILALGSFITSACVSYYSNYLSIIANIISLGILSGYSIGKYSSLIFSLLFSIYSTLSSIVFMFIDWIKRRSKINELVTNKKSRNVLLIIIPIAITIIFFFMYRNANPIFDDLINRINLDFISFSWIFFTLGGLLLCYGFFYHKNISAIADFDKNGKNQLENIEHKSIDFLGKEISMIDELFSGKLMFILLNLLLLFVNFLDFKFLFIDHKLPEGISPSQFVHQGTNTIISSIIFAILIILFYFRGSLNFYKDSSILKYLAYAWIVQNVFLLSSTMMRNNIYVFDFGLTYKRIGVYIYLGLCIIGLLLTVIKIVKTKSNHFLFRANAWVFYAVLVLSCIVNWDNLITHFNMNTSKNLEKKYLLNLSFTNIPDLLKIKQDTITFNQAVLNSDDKYADNEDYTSTKTFVENLDHKIYLFLQDRKKRTWKSWYVDNDRVYKSLVESLNEDKNISLTLTHFRMVDIENLPELSPLKSLNISSNLFTSLSTLTQFKSINRLNISYNSFQDIKEIEQFTSLEYLDISGNPIENYSPIYKLHKLKELKVSKNISIKEIDLLKSNLPGLKIVIE